MPRYFFHLHNDLETRDEEGIDLPDLGTAGSVAKREARLVAAHEVMDGRLRLSHSIEVTNTAGDTVMTVRFDDAIEIAQ